MSSRVIFRPTEPAEAATVAALTFPAYRHLLDLEIQPRHDDPIHGDDGPIQPLAIVATVNDVPVGLAVAETPVDHRTEPELLSVFVRPEVRRQGIGTRLVAEIAATVGDLGFGVLHAVYMTGKLEIVWLEKIFWKLDFEPPDTRMTVLRLSKNDLDKLAWMHWTRIPKSYEIVPWTEIGPVDIEGLKEANAEEDWIPDDLYPWDANQDGFEPRTSMALKVDGRLMGWVLTHALDDTMLRYSCSYIHPSLWRRCALLRLWRASFLRMVETPFTVATLTTHARHPQMVSFIRKHVAPVVSFVAETRGTHKILVNDATTAGDGGPENSGDDGRPTRRESGPGATPESDFDGR